MPNSSPLFIGVQEKAPRSIDKHGSYEFLPSVSGQCDQKSSLDLDLERGDLECVVIEKNAIPTSHPKRPIELDWRNEGRLSRPDNWLPAIIYALAEALIDSWVDCRSGQSCRCSDVSLQTNRDRTTDVASLNDPHSYDSRSDLKILPL